jgi:hypothetical protein
VTKTKTKKAEKVDKRPPKKAAAPTPPPPPEPPFVPRVRPSGLVPVLAPAGKPPALEDFDTASVGHWCEGLRDQYQGRKCLLTVYGLLNAASHLRLNGRRVQVCQTIKSLYEDEFLRERELLHAAIRLGSAPRAEPPPPPEPVKNKARVEVGATHTASGRKKYVLLGDLSVSDAVKWMAANGFSQARVWAALGELGAGDAPANTVSSRFYAASKGKMTYGPVPSLTRDQEKALKGLAKGVD